MINSPFGLVPLFRNLKWSNDYASNILGAIPVTVRNSEVNRPLSIVEGSFDSASHQFVFLARANVLFGIRARLQHEN
jgi:hypothetical protein